MSAAPRATDNEKIGERIYRQVEEMVAAEKITRTEAFQRISDASKPPRRAGTVAANYYRIARLRSDSSVTPRPRKSAATTSDVDAVLARATASINELASLVRTQRRELDQLSAKVAQIDKLRALLRD